MLVQGVRNLQSVNECECRDILTTVENFGQLALEETDVGLETVTLPHFVTEKVVVLLLGLLARDVLSEEHFGYLLKVVERMRRQRVEPIRGHTFQAGRKG